MKKLGQYAKQAGLFLLFGTILMIPRLRRLRRRAWAWSGIRLALAACGGWLVWRYSQAGAGATALAAGLVLLAFSLLVRAKRVVKSLDDMARELDALIVLNGGTFRPSPHGAPVTRTRIFVQPDRLVIIGPDEHRLLEIPMASVRNLATHPANHGTAKRAEAWEMEIDWAGEAPSTATFQFDGTFSEHLARVTEATLRGQWKKDLPVLPS